MLGVTGLGYGVYNFFCKEGQPQQQQPQQQESPPQQPQESQPEKKVILTTYK